MLDLVGNPEDRFTYDVAQIIVNMISDVYRLHDRSKEKYSEPKPKQVRFI